MKPNTKVYNAHIGILLPENLRKKINKLNPFNKTDKLHITLYFLGNTKYKNLGKIFNETRNDINKLIGTQLKINGTGKFKHTNSEILYLKVNKSKILDKTYKSLKKKLKSYHYEKRNYVPHITLKRDKEKIKTAKTLKNFEQSFKITNIALLGRIKEDSGLSESKVIFDYSSD